MADRITIDTQLLDQLSSQIMQVKNSLSTANGDLSRSLWEVRRVAPDQPEIINKLVRTQNNLSTTISHAQKLSKAVGNAAVLWAQAEQKASGLHVPESEIDSEEEARKKREEQAKWFKIGVGAACVIGSIAVVIATGGAALPVVIAGAATGAITAGAFNAADQYAEKGWDNINWGSAGKDAVIGGIVGGVTSYASTAISAGGAAIGNRVVAQVTGRIASTTANSGTILVSHMAGGVVTSVTTGVVTRGTGEVISELAFTGEVNWSNVRDRAFSTPEMALDAAIGGYKGYTTGQRFNQAIAAHESRGEYCRNDKYLIHDTNDPHYGDYNWKGEVGDGINHDMGEPTRYTIPKDSEIVRTGATDGHWVRNASDSYESASIPYTAKEHRYRVVRDIPNTMKSIAAPGFDMPGGATQYELNVSIDDLLAVDNPYIVEIFE